MRCRTRLTALIVAALALFAAASITAPGAQARIIYLGSSAFSPPYAEEPSGVAVTFINSTSVPRHVVSYRIYGSRAWSLDVTVAPFDSYAVPEAFYCSYPSCSWSATYLFRVPEQSRVVVGPGYSYCTGYCGKLVVHS